MQKILDYIHSIDNNHWYLGSFVLIGISYLIFLITRQIILKAGNWSQAGGIAHHGVAGLFWKAIPKDNWPKEQESIDFIKEKWVEPFGDMRQELVFIGQGLDEKKITQALNNCLLTDEDLLLGKNHWESFPDPFPEWKLG